MTSALDRDAPGVEPPRRLKIALVSAYDFAYPGGASIHVSHLDEELRRRGHQVTIVAPSSQSPEALGRPNLVRLGRPVPIPASGSIARVALSLTLSSKVRALLEKERFDVVHLHEPFVSTLPVTFLRLLRDEVAVATFHAYARRKRAYGLSRFLLDRWARRLGARIAVSGPARDYASRYFPGDYRIIPNGVDVDYFAQEIAPLEQFQDGKLNILFLGRLEKRKGLHYLLRAYAQAKWQFPECRLLIAGPGELDKESTRTIAERGLQDVHLLGPVSDVEKPRYYRTADIYCSPATGDESFGMVLLEAMAAGKAIVASPIPGYASVVEDGAQGLLVDPRDEAAFAATLLRLLGDRDLRERMGAAGRARVPRYRWERVTDEIMTVYESLLACQRASAPTTVG
ncbi:MAG: glycosyltransferase family 4 protein [Chloroflexi bacterium]|nr:glycosyltransferase family 4 protein [Chloroflexota bacterium]